MKSAPFIKGLVLVLVLLSLAGGLILVNRIVLGDAFNREEALHAVYSLWITRDIRTFDLNALWYDTQRQMVWPFLHSWLQAIIFLVIGISYISARLLSWLCFLGTVVLIYLFSNKLCSEKGPRVGVVAVLLALTSPMMVQFAAENMIEALGALLFLGTAYLYSVSEERKITSEYLIIALMIGLSIYTNYLYAYLIIPAFLVMTLIKIGPLTLEAIQLRRKGEKEAVHFVWWSYRKVLVLMVLLVLGGIWFSVSAQRKIFLLINSIFYYSGGTEVQGIWQNLIYYPRVIVENISFSPWLGVLLFVALVLPQIAKYYCGLNRVYVYCWTVLLLLTLTISPKAPQMMFIILPFLFIILAGGIVYLFEHLQGLDKRLATGLFLVVFLPALVSVPRLYGVYFPANQGQNMVQVMDYFQQAVPKGAKIVTMVNLKHLNPEVIRFHFRDWPGGVVAETRLEAEELNTASTYFITVELDPDSPYRSEITDDTLYSWNGWLKEQELSGNARFYAQSRFDRVGVTAKVFAAR